MTSMTKCTMRTTGRPQGSLSGLWCISGSASLVASDCLLLTSAVLPTRAYPASSSEPKFATRNQEAGP